MEVEVVSSPSVQLLYTWGSEELIAAMVDVLYKGRGVEEALHKVGEDAGLVPRRIRALFKRGHWSVFEFAGAGFLVECSRVCTHQLVRHRMASYWQESQRYARVRGYLFPRNLPTDLIKAAVGLHEAYENFAEGVGLEYARYGVVNAALSRIMVQMNLRELATNFLPLRMCSRAQAEIRHVAIQMWMLLRRLFPTVMELTGPRCVLEGYCREGVRRGEERACRMRGYEEAAKLHGEFGLRLEELP